MNWFEEPLVTLPKCLVGVLWSFKLINTHRGVILSSKQTYTIYYLHYIITPTAMGSATTENKVVPGISIDLRDYRVNIF